ncbi:stage II sporulation protein P [Metabacillus sp. GX 13764]|uniref:stage II sporulation protein P n=1 Tax=Metabacillus kandeliae TaxID=2900151 RepID=UPI001E63BCCC|nr:stage II sporulation protein P [Metabacillus kandeliae]MCD7035244.1 stage II sporulation protein P [Metabacillus kandeliae]
MRQKFQEGPSFLRTYFRTLFYIILLFSASFFSVLHFKVDVSGMTKALEGIGSREVFTYFFKSENAYYFPEFKSDAFSGASLSNLAIHLATNIKPTDSRSFLGSELPGFSQYDTEIAVAGEGTTLSNIPNESAPPLEALLHERKVAEDQLKKDESAAVKVDPKAVPKNPSVFIYHTHSWEAFVPYLQNASRATAASSDKRVNVIGLGERLTKGMQAKGIGVKHDTTNMTEKMRKEKLNWNKAYTASGEIVDAAAAGQKSLQYYIDIHRDDAKGKDTTKTIKGKKYAKLYFVIGKENPKYQENLSFAKELFTALEKKHPGICRGIYLKTKQNGNGVYNQDVSNKAILVEVGGVDNHLEELNRTVDVFSEVFADYYWKHQNAKEVNGNG